MAPTHGLIGHICRGKHVRLANSPPADQPSLGKLLSRVRGDLFGVMAPSGVPQVVFFAPTLESAPDLQLIEPKWVVGVAIQGGPIETLQRHPLGDTHPLFWVEKPLLE